MIQAFTAKDYGCLRDVRLELTRLHALIGPNDSGKSTLLRGLRTVAHLAGSKFVLRGDDTLKPFTPFFATREGSKLAAEFGGGITYGVENFQLEHLLITEVIAQGETSASTNRDVRDNTNVGTTLPGAKILPKVREVASAHLVRFDPGALREPSGLIPEDQTVEFFDERGYGLPGVYQAILGRGDNAFSEIRESVQELFPTIKNLRVPALSHSELGLEVELTDGTKVRAPQMSEGLLYFLAFAALPFLSPAALLLVEEPENGLHPSRIADVMRVIRQIADSGTQVVLATHSPLIVNCLAPEEVTIVTRPSVEQGTVVTPISKTQHFDERREVFELGELWLSYADGKTEAPLLEGLAVASE